MEADKKCPPSCGDREIERPMSTPVPRYLVPFHPKHMSHFFADVLVVGSGLAGLRAALAVDPKLSVVVATKRRGTIEQLPGPGGIAGVLDPDDRFEDHVADTLEAGGSLCDPVVVERVIREAPQRIGSRSIGARSSIRPAIAGAEPRGRARPRPRCPRLGRRDRQGNHARDVGRRETVAQHRRLGKHFHARPVDARRRLPRRDGLERPPRQDDGLGQADDPGHRRGGPVYRETTNPEVATGDGMALAYRAGAELRDMEFMQFHPTVLYIAGGSRASSAKPFAGRRAAGRSQRPPLHDRLRSARRVGAARRGEPGHCRQMEKTRHPNVYLELNHLDPEQVLARFPASRRCAASSTWTSRATGFRFGRGRTT